MKGPSQTDSGEALSRGLGVPGAEVRVAIFDTGDGSLNLELLEYVNPPSPIERPVPSNAIGAAHLAFRVDDIDAKVKELSEKGVRFNAPVQVIDEGPLTGMPWVYFRGPDGGSMELVELDERFV